MKQNFEKAYKELAEKEVPDLWDRIEAGLSEKSVPEGKKKKTALPGSAGRYAALAAAVACAVILIPAMLVIRQAGGGASASTGKSGDTSAGVFLSAATDTAAAEEAFDAAEMEETTAEADAGADTLADAITDMEAAEEAPEEETADLDGAMEDTDTGDARKEVSSSQAVSQESGKTEEAGSGTEALMESVVNVQIRITEAEDWSIGESAEETGILYTAVVQKETSYSEGKVLTQGENIDIFIPVISSVALRKGCAYELTIALWEEEENLYRLVEYHGQLEE